MAFEKITITHARKEYVCEKCGKKIAVGEENEYHFGGDKKKLINYRLCMKCAQTK